MTANLVAAIVITVSLVGCYAVLRWWYVSERLPAMTATEDVCEFCGRRTVPCPCTLGGCVLGGYRHLDNDSHFCGDAPDSAAAIERTIR